MCGHVLSRSASSVPDRGENGFVAYYRLYFMDARSGHISAFESIEAESDETAVALAEKHVGGQALELWCQGRKVQRFEAIAAAPPSASPA